MENKFQKVTAEKKELEERLAARDDNWTVVTAMSQAASVFVNQRDQKRAQAAITTAHALIDAIGGEEMVGAVEKLAKEITDTSLKQIQAMAEPDEDDEDSNAGSTDEDLQREATRSAQAAKDEAKQRKKDVAKQQAKKPVKEKKKPAESELMRPKQKLYRVNDFLDIEAKVSGGAKKRKHESEEDGDDEDDVAAEDSEDDQGDGEE